VEVARATLEAGATALGVAILEEGLQLRRAGIGAPILIMGWTPRERADAVVAADLQQAVFDLDDCRALAAAAAAQGLRARVHAKLDTGMGRLGRSARTPTDAACAASVLQQVAALPGLELAGVFTHFAGADEASLDGATRQFAAFVAALGELEAVGVRPAVRHCGNTAAILRMPWSHLEMVRAGIGLYGYVPSGHVPPGELRPALSWYTQVAAVRSLRAGDAVSYNGTYVAERPEWVATLPVGYADGLSRHLSNCGRVLLGGHQRPIRGRVCMDQIVISVQDGPLPQRGETVVLLGQQAGLQQWADDLAAWSGTIGYEVLCNISARVPRIYHGQ